MDLQYQNEIKYFHQTICVRQEVEASQDPSQKAAFYCIDVRINVRKKMCDFSKCDILASSKISRMSFASISRCISRQAPSEESVSTEVGVDTTD